MLNIKRLGSSVMFLALVILSCPTGARGAVQDEWREFTVAIIGGAPAVEREDTSAFSKAIVEFYRVRSDQPIWIEEETFSREGLRLLQLLRSSLEQGIDPQDLELPDIRFLDPKFPSAEELAAFDRRLTELFLRYAAAIGIGRATPNEAGMVWGIERPAFDAAVVLHRLQQDGVIDALTEQRPPGPAYQRLVLALARYRSIALRGGWPTIPGGPVLEMGQAGNRVDILRRRLALEGYLAEGEGEGGLFDVSLVRAVRSFQTQNGLAVDGRVGSETLTVLNMPAAARIAMIESNMERWRWMPRELPARRIEVNVAAAELTVFDDDLPVIAMRTIVGSPRHKTPMLQGSIQAVVVNPVWNVPVSITVNEILPRLRREPDYLRQQGIRILDRSDDPYGLHIDWQHLPAGIRFRLQQQAGPLNALGRLKFDIPNRFDVYLHDTPAKALFSRSTRTLSHGCVRLQQPERLALYLLGGSSDHPIPELAAQDTVRISLHRPMPVYLLYWTAFTTADGDLQFHADVYGHDRGIQSALRSHRRRPDASYVAAGGCRGTDGVTG